MLIKYNVSDFSRVLLTATLVPMTTLLFLLNFWADNADLEHPEATQNPSPENMNSFMSSVYLSWMSPLIWLGYRRPMVQDDLFKVPTRVNVDDNVRIFEEQWQSYLKKNNITFNRHKSFNSQKKAALWIPLIKSFGGMYLLASILAFVHYSMTLMCPQVTY
jgi:ATP-binding cassette subfamily C (CFTR/MRP) protein 1